jgi:hypothetical protein
MLVPVPGLQTQLGSGLEVVAREHLVRPLRVFQLGLMALPDLHWLLESLRFLLVKFFCRFGSWISLRKRFKASHSRYLFFKVGLGWHSFVFRFAHRTEVIVHVIRLEPFKTLEVSLCSVINVGKSTSVGSVTSDIHFE